ncbi:MAG TPA: PA14 domain-containing protein [Anaerolineales bacterium]|jgi:hypothetical protein
MKHYKLYVLVSTIIIASTSGIIGQASNPVHAQEPAQNIMITTAPTATSVAGANPCIPGTGWNWTSGPSQPEAAQKAQFSLEQKGITGLVVAYAFGENDSCGNFVQSATDFSLTLTNSSLTSVSSQAELAETILAVFSDFGKPRLGNVQITFGPGDIKFYPPDQSLAGYTPAPNIGVDSNAILNKKVYLLVYDPILSSGKKLSEDRGWNSYSTLVNGIISSFQSASHGQLQYSIAFTSVVDNEWPILVDGFRYTEATYFFDLENHILRNPWEVNYDAIIDDPRFDLCGKLNNNQIDELWVFGGPLFGFYESRLVGPNGYWFNSGPIINTHGCNRLMPIMGLNYERGVPEALESFGHRTESTMTRTYGSWQENRTAHNWDRYALVKAQSPNFAYSGCGSIHYPPNGVKDYDFGNNASVLTNCEDFQNYPNLSEPLSVALSLTCTTWGCNHLGYMMYWYSHLPSNEGCATDARMNNWWQYFSDPNLAVFPNLLCPPAPCPTITNWKGEYWQNSNFIGPPALCRDDPEINFDWEYGSPDPIIQADNYSVRWTREINFDDAEYRFHLQHDDGGRLFIDNVLVGDFWNICCDWDAVDVPISAGSHSIRMEMFENGGAAHARLWWQDISITISGNVGSPNTQLTTMLNGQSKSVFSNTSGEYLIKVPHGWSGTITPSNPGYIFSPTSTSYSNLSENQINQNYLANPVPPGVFDKTKPSNDAIQKTIVTLSWGASEGASSYEYCAYNNNENGCSIWLSTGTDTSKTLTGLSHGSTYHWQVRARKATSLSYANGLLNAFWSFKVDGVAPKLISILRAENNANTPTRLVFKVNFSEPVTGVDASDFKLTILGNLRAGITGVSGSGKTYTVVVNSSRGNGSVKLNLVDDDSIIDTAGNPLGGLGTGNGGTIIGPMPKPFREKQYFSSALLNSWVLQNAEFSALIGRINTAGMLALGDNYSAFSSR